MLNILDLLSDLFDGFGQDRDEQERRPRKRGVNDMYEQQEGENNRRNGRRDRDFDFFGD